MEARGGKEIVVLSIQFRIRKVPVPLTVYFAIWHDDNFLGVAAWGGTKHLGRSFLGCPFCYWSFRLSTFPLCLCLLLLHINFRLEQALLCI